MKSSSTPLYRRETAETNLYPQPNLLEDLLASQEAVPQKLDASTAASSNVERQSFINDEAAFRFAFNEEQMAVEKLREGISKFAADAVTLKDIVRAKINA